MTMPVKAPYQSSIAITYTTVLHPSFPLSNIAYSHTDIFALSYSTFTHHYAPIHFPIFPTNSSSSQIISHSSIYPIPLHDTPVNSISTIPPSLHKCLLNSIKRLFVCTSRLLIHPHPSRHMHRGQSRFSAIVVTKQTAMQYPLLREWALS